VPFTHFDYSSTMPTDQQLAADVVSLLATTATLAGQDRAITTAAEVVDADRLVAALPYLQVAVVEPRLRHSAKRADVTFAGLRSELAERLDVEMPEVAPARRVKWSDVAMAVFAIFAANALIAQTPTSDSTRPSRTSARHRWRGWSSRSGSGSSPTRRTTSA
jgi:hypothetical protein